jgi:glucosamine kinase
LLTELFTRFNQDPHAIVSWTAGASPRDYGSFAPAVIEHAERGDAAGVELMRLAAHHIDEMALRLVSFGADRLALVGGIASRITQWLDPETRSRLVPPAGDALDGALRLAREAARSPRRISNISTAAMEQG